MRSCSNKYITCRTVSQQFMCSQNSDQGCTQNLRNIYFPARRSMVMSSAMAICVKCDRCFASCKQHNTVEYTLRGNCYIGSGTFSQLRSSVAAVHSQAQWFNFLCGIHIVYNCKKVVLWNPFENISCELVLLKFCDNVMLTVFHACLTSRQIS